MTDQQRLLKAICQSPEDDVVRLVYADWLEENGDAERARFIRVQCRLASLPRFDLERYELEGEESALRVKHGKKWLKPLAKITTNVEFQRGFPHRFALPAAKFVAKGEELFAAAPTLREYRVLQPNAAWEQLLDCPALEKVTSFDAGQHGITIPRTQALARSKRVCNLRRLDLYGSALSKSLGDLAVSPALAKLEWLNVRKCGFGTTGLGTLLKAKFAGNLKFLDVSQNELHSAAVGLLAKWQGASRLEDLTIGEGHLGDDDARAFAGGDWSGLRRLCLFFHRMSTAGLDALGQCASLAGLRSLNLYHAQDQRLDGLLSSPHLAGLETLFLQGRSNPAALADAPLLSSLRSLWLSWIEADALHKALANPASAGLRELKVCGSPDEARRVAGAVAAAPHLTNLRKLRISQVGKLGAEGARALGESAHLAGLVELDFTWGCLDEDGAKVLVASPHLNRLRRLAIGSGYPGLSRPTYAALEERFGKDVVTRN
jgi:uncharacterized protein (TIGR02996 family)